jgi:fluoride exporter
MSVAEPWSRSVLCAVAAGGSIGAGLRWAVSTSWQHVPGAWPWATLLVNVCGCLAIGIAARRLVSGTMAWAFVVTGLLGGFTTFSAFAIELNDLVDADRAALAALYGAITLTAGIGATTLAGRTSSTAALDAP